MIDEKLKENAKKVLSQRKCDLETYESILAGLVVYQSEIFETPPAPDLLVAVANAIETDK